MAAPKDDYLVLYVDDDWNNRAVFEQNFGNTFRVKSVARGDEALEVLKKEEVAVVVADQRMPGMSGNELLSRVSKAYPGIVRVIVTAYEDLDPILRAVNEGLVHRYLMKPWERKELETVLCWAVELFTLGKEESQLQLRLLASERLITVGSIAQRVFHDMGNAMNAAKQDVVRLAYFAEAADVLAELARERSTPIPEAFRKRLSELAEEFPDLSESLTLHVERVAGLTKSMRRLLDPQEDEEPLVSNPASVIAFTARVFRQMAHSHLAIVYDGPETLPAVRIGSTELYQVLINLVSNAVQSFAGEPRPGSLVSLHVVDERDKLRFVVQDTGAGMTPDVLGSAGILFFTTKRGGAGLGLANCKRIIHGRKGELKLDSKPGEGTKATFTLPKA